MNQNNGDGYPLESLKVLEGLEPRQKPDGHTDGSDWVEATLDELFADIEMPTAGFGPAEAPPKTETDPEELQFASLVADVRFNLLDESERDDFSEAVMLASGGADARPEQEPSNSDDDLDELDDLYELDEFDDLLSPPEPGDNNWLWLSLKEEMGSPAALAAAVFARLREVEPIDGPDQAYDLEAVAMVEDLTLAGDQSGGMSDDFIMGKLIPLIGPHDPEEKL